jgi:hypothetical protein
VRENACDIHIFMFEKSTENSVYIPSLAQSSTEKITAFSPSLATTSDGQKRGESCHGGEDAGIGRAERGVVQLCEALRFCLSIIFSQKPASTLADHALTALPPLFHRQNHIAHNGIDFLLPALAVEDAVMADIGLEMMALQMRA